ACTDRHGYRLTFVGNLETALEALGGGHRDCPNQFIAQVLLHFESHLGRLVFNLVFNRQSVVDPGQCSGEVYIHHRAGNFYDRTFIHIHSSSQRAEPFAHAVWPPAISSNSFVILPCRCLLYSSDRSLIRRSALSVAFFIDTIRALCSLALASSKT